MPVPMPMSMSMHTTYVRFEELEELVSPFWSMNETLVAMNGFLLPSLATPLALILPAGGSPCASSVDATSCATALLPPNLHDASLSSLSLIGSLTLITRVIFPPMTAMTTMTSTRRSTGEIYPLECL